MKHLFAFVAVALSLSMSPVMSQTVPSDDQCGDDQAAGTENDPDCPAVVLPDGLLPVGQATNLVFIAPAIGGILALGALGGGSTSSTTSTVSTTN